MKSQALLIICFCFTLASYSKNSESLSDTAHKRIFNFSINAGLSFPQGEFFSGQYKINMQDPWTYGGFASNGYLYNCTLGLPVHKGFEVTLIGMHIHDGFDATGFLHEMLAIREDLYTYSNVTSIGNYYYDHNAIFLGFTNDWHLGAYVSIGLRGLLGAYFFKIPAVQGTADTNTIGYTKVAAMNVQIAGASKTRTALDLGARLGVKILPPIKVLLCSDLIYSYTGNSNPYNPTVAMFNVTLGIQYEL